MSLTKGQQADLQTMHVLRFAKNVRIKDMISRTELHKGLNLCQRREKQLLILMYKLLKKRIIT